MARPSQYELTPKIIKDVTAFIASGGFPHVAAEAAGVPADVFEEWLARGDRRQRKKDNPLYRQLRDEVRKARAAARLTAEMAVFTDNPRRWLQEGPGKETNDSPGWSVPVKPVVRETNTQVNLLLSPQMQGLFAALLQVLAPWPEARAAVAQALVAERPRAEMKGG